MNPLTSTQFNQDALTIIADSREADDLAAFLQALSVNCSLTGDADAGEPGKQTIAIGGSPDAKELERIGILVEEFNKMRKSRASFGS